MITTSEPLRLLNIPVGYLLGSLRKKSLLTTATTMLGKIVEELAHQMSFIWWFMRLQAASRLPTGRIIEPLLAQLRTFHHLDFLTVQKQSDQL